VLDDPPVLDAEDVDDGLPQVTGEEREVVVQDDAVSSAIARWRRKDASDACANRPPMRSGKTAAPPGAVGLCWV